jgi:predicted kinase
MTSRMGCDWTAPVAGQPRLLSHRQKCRVRVVLMCRPAGSGKSTVARRLEADGLVRQAAHAACVTPETMFIDTPPAVALARVEARRHAHPDDFHVVPEPAASYFDGFERPSPDEGPLTIISGTT